MDIHKKKNIIRVFLFNLCLVFALYSTYSIIDNTNHYQLQQYDKTTQVNMIPYKFNIDDINDVYNTNSKNDDTNYIVYIIHDIINLVWYLFLGSILYGKIKE